MDKKELQQLRQKQHQIEQELKKSKAAFDATFEQAAVGIAHVSPKGKFLRVNNKLCDIIGYNQTEMLARTFQEITHPDDLGQDLLQINLLLTGKMDTYSMEKRYIHKDRSLVCVRLTSSIVRNESIESAWFVSVVEDITEKKVAEDNLKKAFSQIKALKDQLDVENIYLKEEIKSIHGFRDIIGKSLPLNYVFQRLKSVAPTDATVLIEGETGTGKELIARALHNESLRKNKHMITVGCAALSSSLIESEVFGHEKGAFTGANTRRIGRFELANKSTIFLDEIGELSLELQAKLLRVIEEGEFERLGSSKTIKVDIRIITATNRNLEEEVRKGRFREDLYYRLSTFVITAPPLRERKGDIPLLVNYFVGQYCKNTGKTIKTIPRATMKILEKYTWPGNVRELQNVIEHAIIVSKKGVLKIEMPVLNAIRDTDNLKLEDVERDHILKVLEKTNWRLAGKGGAAELLGMKRTTLQSRMKKLGIKMKK